MNSPTQPYAQPNKPNLLPIPPVAAFAYYQMPKHPCPGLHPLPHRRQQRCANNRGTGHLPHGRCDRKRQRHALVDATCQRRRCFGAALHRFEWLQQLPVPNARSQCQFCRDPGTPQPQQRLRPLCTEAHTRSRGHLDRRGRPSQLCELLEKYTPATGCPSGCPPTRCAHWRHKRGHGHPRVTLLRSTQRHRHILQPPRQPLPQYSDRRGQRFPPDALPQPHHHRYALR